MSDTIHLDKTGITTDFGASVDSRVTDEAARRDVKNEARLTACGLQLSDVQYRGVADIALVTCEECKGEDYQHEVKTAGGPRGSGSTG